MASFLIKHVRIFDGEKTIENGSVLVENGKIVRVSEGSIDFAGQTFSKPGHTLFPGLIDTHIHANSADVTALPQALRFGVTTVCDMANEWYNIQKLRKQRETGSPMADIKTTSFAATIDGGWPMAIVLRLHDSPEVRAEIATWPKLVTAEDGRKYVQDRVKEGVDYIKLMHESGTSMNMQLPMPSIELQKAVTDEAHKHGLLVVAHATSLQDTLDILAVGIDGTTHTFIDQPPTQAVINAYRKNNAHCNPTLAAMGSGTTEGKAMQEKYAHDPRVERLLFEGGKERMCACMAFAKDIDGATTEHAFETVRQLKANGVLILMGSDSAGPAVGTAFGLSAHMEMALFVEKCGFTPEEALVAATSAPAKRFGFSDRGLIREGLRADLVLVDGNPLEDLDHTLNLRGVWTEGRLCDSFEL